MFPIKYICENILTIGFMYTPLKIQVKTNGSYEGKYIIERTIIIPLLHSKEQDNMIYPINNYSTYYVNGGELSENSKIKINNHHVLKNIAFMIDGVNTDDIEIGLSIGTKKIIHNFKHYKEKCSKLNHLNKNIGCELFCKDIFNCNSYTYYNKEKEDEKEINIYINIPEESKIYNLHIIIHSYNLLNMMSGLAQVRFFYGFINEPPNNIDKNYMGMDIVSDYFYKRRVYYI